MHDWFSAAFVLGEAFRCLICKKRYFNAFFPLTNSWKNTLSTFGGFLWGFHYLEWVNKSRSWRKSFSQAGIFFPFSYNNTFLSLCQSWFNSGLCLGAWTPRVRRLIAVSGCGHVKFFIWKSNMASLHLSDHLVGITVTEQSSFQFYSISSSFALLHPRMQTHLAFRIQTCHIFLEVLIVFFYHVHMETEPMYFFGMEGQMRPWHHWFKTDTGVEGL